MSDEEEKLAKQIIELLIKGAEMGHSFWETLDDELSKIEQDDEIREWLEITV